jgi:hypothetical protein
MGENSGNHDVEDLINESFLINIDMSNQGAAEIIILYLKTFSPIEVIRILSERHPLNNKLRDGLKGA